MEVYKHLCASRSELSSSPGLKHIYQSKSIFVRLFHRPFPSASTPLFSTLSHFFLLYPNTSSSPKNTVQITHPIFTHFFAPPVFPFAQATPYILFITPGIYQDDKPLPVASTDKAPRTAYSNKKQRDI